ncbi:MAG TPA: fumarylacetoacetate hydrolase family protein, partial [Candidatus Acidoferrum sp.]|nr:fumarylacetoacetate hydrolase family protein [Candidatus Acidoferrum sp.]
MTFVTIRRGEDQSLGIKTDRGILDVRKAEATFKEKAPTTITEVFQRGGGPALQRLVDRAQAAKANGFFLSEDKIEYGPCVTHPEKIVCIGLNYRRHAAETGQPVPSLPILFNKYNNALNFHRGVIKVSQEKAEKFDYEVELVIVMGKVARDVGEAEALSHVFGYATGNDFSARDLQFRDGKASQFMLGKTSDGFMPVGPWLVGADLVGDPQKLAIECRVNGEQRQS